MENNSLNINELSNSDNIREDIDQFIRDSQESIFQSIRDRFSTDLTFSGSTEVSLPILPTNPTSAEELNTILENYRNSLEERFSISIPDLSETDTPTDAETNLEELRAELENYRDSLLISRQGNFAIIPDFDNSNLRDDISSELRIIEVEIEEDINFSELSEPGTAVKIDGDLYLSITPQGRINSSIRPEDVSVFGDLDISARGFEFSEDTPVRIFDTSNEGDVVYSLFNNQTNLQFYTADENEKDEVLRGVPEYESRGVLFVAAPEPEVDDITGVSPVYRLFNASTGVHLYTVDENEKNYVVENLNYELEGSEGVAFYGYDEQVEGTVPLYRFRSASLDAHFYTPSLAERDEYIANPDFSPEGDNDGIAFYVNPAPEGEL